MAGDRMAAAFIAKQVAPAATARGAAIGGAAMADRASAANKRNPPALGGATRQQQLGIVDDMDHAGNVVLFAPGEEARLVEWATNASQPKARCGDWCFIGHASAVARLGNCGQQRLGRRAKAHRLVVA